MAENIQLSTGSGGDILAADEISTLNYQRVKLVHGVDGTNDGDVATSNPYPVDVREIGGLTVLVDNAPFTDGTTPVLAIGYIFDDVAGVALTENDIAAARIDSKRSQIVTIEGSVRGTQAEVGANGLEVDVQASALPTGAATSALQLAAGHTVTIQSNASVNVAQYLGATASPTNPQDVQISDGTVSIPFPTALVGGRFSVDVGASALPTGAALSASQLAAGHAVGLNPLTTGGWSVERDIDLDEATPANIKASAGQVGGWYLYNNASTTMYVKLYNKATAPVIGTDAALILLTIAIPAGAAANVELANGIPFSSGIGWTATGAVGDTDTTAPAANDVVANLLYK